MAFAQDIASIKAALDIRVLWESYGLPGKPGESCKSPWREDKTPSFSVRKDTWKDFTTGEQGDAIDFIQRVEGCSAGEAIAKAVEIAGGAATQQVDPAKYEPKKRQDPQALPIQHLLRDGAGGEHAQLCQIRNLAFIDPGLTFGPFAELEKRKMLRFGIIEGQDCWIVTDPTLYNAQARRMDGAHITVIGQGDGDEGVRRVKAKTLPGSRASWPLGLRDAKDRHHWLIIEGGPDLLAAACAIDDYAGGEFDQFGFIVFTGAGNVFPVEEFEGVDLSTKKFTIFGHHDANRAGQKAATRWMGQLVEAGATDLLSFRFVGCENCKDVNDAMTLNDPNLNSRLKHALNRGGPI